MERKVRGSRTCITNLPSDLYSLSHHELKEYGNKYFAASDIQRAIECFDHAIKKSGSISTYYSNRALCYLKLKQYDKVFCDCRSALDLDPRNVKALFFAGQSHLALGQYDEAIGKLTSAYSLAAEQRRNFGDDISSAIRIAKRKRFEYIDEERRQQEIELQTYLNRLIIEDAKKRRLELAKIAQSAGLSKEVVDKMVTISASNNTSPPADDRPDVVAPNVTVSPPPMTADQLAESCSHIDTVTASRLQEVDDLFAQVDDRRKKREVPDYLCGQISFELMLDPVITPSGITYDRRSIQTHLRQVGHFDPITREPLTEDRLIPNLAMREVVAHYLDENSWAESY